MSVNPVVQPLTATERSRLTDMHERLREDAMLMDAQLSKDCEKALRELVRAQERINEVTAVQAEFRKAMGPLLPGGGS